MNRWLFLFIYLLSNLIIKIHSYCPNDEDLQAHRCTCSLTQGYIQCSSFPRTCRTCFRYHTIYFDENIANLPIEAFRFYQLFNSNLRSNQTFTIQFVQLNDLTTNLFSKINLEQDHHLFIKIGKYSSSIIPTRLFEDLVLQTKSTFDFEIFNVTSTNLIFEQYTFDGIKHGFDSLVKFSIVFSKKSLEFESNAGSLLLPPYSKMELYFSNFENVLLNEHSFDHITQEHSSQFRLHFDHFHSATLEHTAFFDLHQLEQSKFSLTFSNLNYFDIEKILFHSITQLNSDVIISIYNLTNDLCFSNETFSQIKQDMNSTFQIDINYGQNLLFNSHSFLNITQRAQSTFSIVITNCLNIYFSKKSLTNIHQEDQSLIDIWIKSSENLFFDNNAIEYIDIYRSSMMRIGYQYSRGSLQMLTNSFQHINEKQGGHLLFQIINSTNFSFRFNQSIQLERLEIVDRLFSDEDFCRIVNIPSHIPVELRNENPCSCSVFYLYRYLRHRLNPYSLKDLTPLCYSQLSLDQIEYQEKQCQFDKQTRLCQQIEGNLQIHIPYGICQKQIRSNSIKYHSNSSIVSLMFISGFILVILICFYIFFKPKRENFMSTLWNQICFYRRRRQKLPIFTADSYQQLTHIIDDYHNDDNQQKTMKIIVKYNSTTDQTQPYIQTNQSDFLISNEDIPLKLNTNPLSDIEDKLNQ